MKKSKCVTAHLRSTLMATTTHGNEQVTTTTTTTVSDNDPALAMDSTISKGQAQERTMVVNVANASRTALGKLNSYDESHDSS